MGELAGDKYSIQKRATRCILPRKRPRDRSRTLSSNPISGEIQAFQRGVDHAHEACDDGGVSGLQALAREIHGSRGLQLVNRQLGVIQLQPFQRGTEKPNRKRDALVSRFVGIG